MEIAVINYEDPKTLELIRNTVAQGTNDNEFALFMQMAKATGLNPFKKEIWCIVTGKDNYRKIQMMTGVNGFFTIANSNASYDGMELKYGDLVDIALPDNADGVPSIKVPEWVECLVYRKDRTRPQSARAYWHEYAKDLVGKPSTYNGKTTKGKLGIWAKMSSIMLAKCAKSMALREAFPQELNGFYSQEEMPAEFSVNNVAPKKANVFSEPVYGEIKGQQVELAPGLKTSFADDEIPETWDKQVPEMVEAEEEPPTNHIVYKYNIESYFENEDRANRFENYLVAVKDKGVKFHVVEMTLFSESRLKQLEEHLIKE